MQLILKNYRKLKIIYKSTQKQRPLFAWAMGMRIEDIRPTFDVFCLGELLWAIVSDKPLLQLWYFNRPQFNLEQMFPHAPSIKMANPLFEKCIVENEEDCLPDATALLEEVDKVLTIIDRNGDLIDENIKRPCKVCGIGDYELRINQDEIATHEFGLNPRGNWKHKIFMCNYCGHVQLFGIGTGEINPPPPAWSS